MFSLVSGIKIKSKKLGVVLFYPEYQHKIWQEHDPQIHGQLINEIEVSNSDRIVFQRHQYWTWHQSMLLQYTYKTVGVTGQGRKETFPESCVPFQ